MPNLTREAYRSLYESLAQYEDVERLSREKGLDPELLMVIYTHRVTRDATKRYYVVMKHVPRLLREWQRGKSYVALARELGFPPVLVAQMIEKHKQTSRRAFWDGFRHPEAIPDARLRREVLEVLENDWIYSPRGGEIQRERGVKGEARLARWLQRHGLTYRTEKDLRGKFSKTPDALLDHPVWIRGQRVSWIESKANFGDDVELRRNLRKQLEPYVRMFGEGIVVYWYGHIEGAQGIPGVQILDGDTFETLVPSGPPPGASEEPLPHPSAPAPVTPAARASPPRETAEEASATPSARPRPRRPLVDRSAYF